MIEKPVQKTDNETQTDTHFHETNIVAFYEWNEWELRRKAIKLVSCDQRHSLAVFIFYYFLDWTSYSLSLMVPAVFCIT